MAATPQTTADKATRRLLDDIDKLLERADRATRLVPAAGRADLERARKAVQAGVDGAGKLAATAARARLRAVMKSAQALALAAEKRRDLAYDQRRRQELRAEAGAILAEAMLLIGRIEDRALAQAVLAEQQKHRARLDAAEKIRDDAKALQALFDLFNRDRIEALLPLAREAQGMAAWLRASFEPARARAAAAVKGLGAAPCRKALDAEIARAVAAKDGAMARMDLAAAKGTPLAALQRVEKLAARIAALCPALDREMARLGKLLLRAGRPAALSESLRTLVLAKAGGWPRGGSAGEVEREIGAFESAVSRFAREVEKAAAIAAKAPAAR